MEIEENVNPRTERRWFSKIALENRKNMHSQIVAPHSRDLWFLDLSRSTGLCQVSLLQDTLIPQRYIRATYAWNNGLFTDAPETIDSCPFAQLA